MHRTEVIALRGGTVAKPGGGHGRGKRSGKQSAAKRRDARQQAATQDTASSLPTATAVVPEASGNGGAVRGSGDGYDGEPSQRRVIL